MTLANPLAGKALRYLIGADSAGDGSTNWVTVAPYGEPPARRGISIGYCNLFDEENTGRYKPYLHTSDTASDYGEGQIDPRGPGWLRNLNEQFARRRDQQFEYIELDNPDAYSIDDVMGAISLAYGYGMKVIAKNPGLMQGGSNGALTYVKHPNIFGMIVERNGGDPSYMHQLRLLAGKPDLPVWFVAFGSGRSWAKSVANTAKNYRHMGVTYSPEGEYETAKDILVPLTGSR